MGGGKVRNEECGVRNTEFLHSIVRIPHSPLRTSAPSSFLIRIAQECLARRLESVQTARKSSIFTIHYAIQTQKIIQHGKCRHRRTRLWSGVHSHLSAASAGEYVCDLPAVERQAGRSG